MSRARQKKAELSSVEGHMGYWLRYVSNHVSYAFARKLQASGATVAEWVILRHMYERPPVAPSEWAKVIGLTRGAVSRLIDRLYRRKLVTREEDTKDRRFQVVALTPEGVQLVRKLSSLADQNEAEFFSSLTARECEELLSMMKKLVRANHLSRIPVD